MVGTAACRPIWMVWIYKLKCALSTGSPRIACMGFGLQLQLMSVLARASNGPELA